MLAIIKHDCMLSEYDAERLSKIYAEQIERGALVLSKGCSVAIIEPVLDVEAEEIETE